MADTCLVFNVTEAISAGGQSSPVALAANSEGIRFTPVTLDAIKDINLNATQNIILASTLDNPVALQAGQSDIVTLLGCAGIFLATITVDRTDINMSQIGITIDNP